MKKTKLIAQAGIIAALYVVLTYFANLLGIASGVIQCRLSEALCVLPVFTFAAVPGLFIGCLAANLLTGCVITDVICGSLATLIGAVCTYLLRKKNKFLAPIPPIAANAIIMPFVIKFAYGSEGTLWYFALTVGIGEIISCGVLGMILYFALEKNSKRIFH